MAFDFQAAARKYRGQAARMREEAKAASEARAELLSLAARWLQMAVEAEAAAVRHAPRAERRDQAA